MCCFILLQYVTRFVFERAKSYNTFGYFLLFSVFFSCFFYYVLRTDSVSLSKEGELDSSLSHDLLPSTCPDLPVLSSNAFNAADTHQEEGKYIT